MDVRKVMGEQGDLTGQREKMRECDGEGTGEAEQK